MAKYRIKTMPMREKKRDASNPGRVIEGPIVHVPAYRFMVRDANGNESPLPASVIEIDDEVYDVTGQEHKLEPEHPRLAREREERQRMSAAPENREITTGKRRDG